MYCEHCGAGYGENAGLCYFCGARLPGATEGEVPVTESHRDAEGPSDTQIAFMPPEQAMEIVEHLMVQAAKDFTPEHLTDEDSNFYPTLNDQTLACELSAEPDEWTWEEENEPAWDLPNLEQAEWEFPSDASPSLPEIEGRSLLRDAQLYESPRSAPPSPREEAPSKSPTARPDRVEWFVGMDPKFIKNVPSDKKLAGRVLEALTEICVEPMKQKGDTVKPLEGDLKGLWRYRIADWRLVYRPDPQQRRITLLSFESRGSVY
jgi:mRNA-degrading endonuclease RelE of RelBE toxin-antitoxin system